jgi:hypothetical protein
VLLFSLVFAQARRSHARLATLLISDSQKTMQ